MKASALLNIWLLKQNGTKDPNGELIDPVAMEWEVAFIKEIILKDNFDVPKELTVNGFTDRRYAKNLIIRDARGKKESTSLCNFWGRKCEKKLCLNK